MKKTVPLKKNYEFARIYKKGRFYAGRFIVLYVLKNNYRVNRLGIAINRKVGKSVRRNRVRRLIRECYRFYEEFLKDDLDLVFMARSTEKIPDYSEINKEMKFLLKKLEILDMEKWNA
jgi:ribonuclease P protein component